eukprot:TRINITY_DN39152_c0_g3_i7.p1 TRINITY_DN39152_c0_g3~~TRINITY_DN39152_c0_g3_i7.p1  ORF type:complete len:104 (-),score=4.88 TRINITY_DN39152_c0_g3_i7:199-510(-)
MDTYCFRVAITQLRFNVLPLNNNMHRYSEHSKDKNCPFCEKQIENEHHLLFDCVLYKDLRVKFLKESTKLPLYVLLKSTNMNHRHNVSRFVFHALNRRTKVIS